MCLAIGRVHTELVSPHLGRRELSGGLVYDLDLGSDDALRALAYYGNRGVTQYLAIPAATQANPRHSGGVVDLATDYGGGDLRWTHHGRVAATLRGDAAVRFLADVESGDPQLLMARVTGNYKRGNERAARRHPRNG